MEQEKGKKRREKKGPGTVPEAPTLKDFYVDPCTRLGDHPDSGGDRLNDGIKSPETTSPALAVGEGGTQTE